MRPEEPVEETVVPKQAEVTILGQETSKKQENTGIDIQNEELTKQEQAEVEKHITEKKEETSKGIHQKDSTSSDDETIEDTKKEKKSTSHHRKIIAIIIAILVLIGLAFSTVFALINKGSDKIIEGVQIKEIDVSGLTREEAENKLKEVFSEQFKKEILLKHGEYETKLTPEQIELNFKVSEVVELAYSKGRTGNILKYKYLIL